MKAMGLPIEDNDNLLAREIDVDAAIRMEAEGYDVRFVDVLTPAFYNRENGQWSVQTWHEDGQPCATLLNMDFGELLEQFERHRAGDASLCVEWRRDALESIKKAVAHGKKVAARVRAQAESRAWDELNEMSLAGDGAATAEVIERAVNESGQETPIYDSLLAKHWTDAAKEMA